MKGIKVTLAAAASALLLAAPAMAYHSGGVADCDGCHSMHNSLNGVAMSSADGGVLYQSGPYLLQTGPNGQASDACLNCHENAKLSSYHVSTPGSGATVGGLNGLPNNRTPGGDFSWLKLNTGHKGGHNINGIAHGFTTATKFSAIGNVGPGGSYPAGQLQCSSCHDPHGKYRRLSDGTIALPVASAGSQYLPIAGSGSYNTSLVPTATFSVGVYRILGGIGYLPASMEGTPGLAFSAGQPVAIAPATYNQSESTNQTKVAYGSGMSEWCANCHNTLLANEGTSNNSTDGGHTHPVGATALLSGGATGNVANTGTIAQNYNAYISSGNLGGTSTSSYESLVPFEEGLTGTAANYATLQGLALSNAATYVGVDTSTANAMCLSCHRAHATGFDSMLRYEIDNEFMTAVDSAGVVSYDANFSDVDAWKKAAYNDKPATRWGAYQRVLCNKCHAKD